VGGENERKMYYFRILVDGTALGYYSTRAKIHDKEYYGVWSQADGVSKNRSLCFEKPRVDMISKSTISTSNNGLMGSVQVDIYEAINPHITTVRNFSSNAVAPVLAPSSSENGLKKKVIRSCEGFHEVSSKTGPTTLAYQQGGLVESIVIHYCSAHGLIGAGVLASVSSALTTESCSEDSSDDEESDEESDDGETYEVKPTVSPKKKLNELSSVESFCDVLTS